MLGQVRQSIDSLAFGFVAYGAIFAGVVVLILSGLRELSTAAILIVGGVMLAAVRRYVGKRLAEEEEEPR